MKLGKILSIILMLYPLLIIGQEGFYIQKSSPWIKPIKFGIDANFLTSDIDDGGVYFLADFQTDIEKEEKFNHYAIKLVSESGIQNYSDVWVDYDPSYQKLIFHKMVVHRNGETHDKLEINEFKVIQNESDLNRKLYNGTFSAGIFLEDIRVGDIIEYAYTVKGFNPIFNDHFFTAFNLHFNVPVKKFYRSFVFSSLRPISFHITNGGKEPKKSENQNLTTLVWEDENLQDIVENSGVPSWYSAYALVQITEFEDWNQLIAWSEKLYPYKIEPSNELEAMLKGIKNDYPSPAELINAMIRFVQDDIRYLGIEVDEYSYRPRNPNSTFQKRYGDCKDKSYLLSYMLRKAGIDANVAYVNTKKKHTISDFPPSPILFNHVIVSINFEGSMYFVDATNSSQTSDFRELYNGNYGKALIINSRQYKPVAVPMYSSEKIIIHETIHVKDTVSPVKYDVTSTYYGGEADRIRSSRQNSTKNELNNSYLNFYSNLYANMELAEEIQYENSGDSNQINVIEKYLIHDFWEYNNSYSDYVCNINASNLLYYISDPDQRNREMPYGLYHPIDIQHEIRFYHNKDINIEKLAGQLNNNNFTFTYDIQQLDNQSILFKFTYKTLKDYVSLDEMGQYLTDIDEIYEQTYYEFTYGAGLDSNSGGLNWMMVIISLFFVIILLFSTPFIYRTNMGLQTSGKPIPLGGWLFFPVIGVFLTPIILIIQMYNIEFYNLHIWEMISSPKSEYYDPWFAGLFIYEVLINWLFVIYSLFLILLLVKRRNIFPYHYAFFRTINLGLLILDAILSKNISSGLYDLQDNDYTDIYRSVLGAAIWIPYILLSQRVKETFTRPYISRDWNSVGSIEKRDQFTVNKSTKEN